MTVALQLIKIIPEKNTIRDQMLSTEKLTPLKIN